MLSSITPLGHQTTRSHSLFSSQGSLLAPRVRASNDINAPSKLARSLLKGWGLIDLPLRAFNEGSPRPRVARAQKIISLYPLPIFSAVDPNPDSQ